MKTRPAAIRRFERLYLASTLAWVAGAALSWGERQRMIAANAALAGNQWLVPAGFALVLALTLVLWWQAARRGSIFARTGVAGMAVLSGLVIVLTLIGMASGRGSALPTNLFQLLSSGLGIVAGAALFRNDARAWFCDPPADPRG